MCQESIYGFGNSIIHFGLKRATKNSQKDIWWKFFNLSDGLDDFFLDDTLAVNCSHSWKKIPTHPKTFDNMTHPNNFTIPIDIEISVVLQLLVPSCLPKYLQRLDVRFEIPRVLIKYFNCNENLLALNRWSNYLIWVISQWIPPASNPFSILSGEVFCRNFYSIHNM